MFCSGGLERCQWLRLGVFKPGAKSVRRFGQGGDAHLAQQAAFIGTDFTHMHGVFHGRRPSGMAWFLQIFAWCDVIFVSDAHPAGSCLTVILL